MGLELYAFSETPRAREIPFVMKSACYVSFYLFVLSFLKPSVVFSCPSPLEGDDCTDFVTICPAGHKCHYGGECTNIGCTCPPGRVGHSCRFRESDLRTSPKLCDVAHSTIEQITCYNDASCAPNGGCSCSSPWEGDDCTDFVTICPAGHKCHYGGECTNIGCTCPPGRVGHSCRFSAEQLQNSDGVKKQNEAITGVAVTVSLSFLALLALVFFMVRRERQGMPVFSSSLEVHKDEPTDSRVWLK